MHHLLLERETVQHKRYAKMTRGLTDLVGHDTYRRQSTSDQDDEEEAGPDESVKFNTSLFDSHEIGAPLIAERPESRPSTYKEVFDYAAEVLRLSLDADLTILAEDFSDLEPTQTSDSSARVGISCSVSKQPFMDAILSFEHPQDMIETLGRRWPLGKIWVRDDNNFFVGLEDERHRPTERRASTKSSDSQTDADECDWLGSWLPKARQVVFVPLWDAANTPGASACFIMSQHNLPTFSAQVEVPFIRAFLNSLNVICGQLTLQLADQQKNQLLSSISHELRSPLHGIIAAVEMLSATTLSPSQRDLCESIDVCSQTLLDTMSLVMDHAMVNSFVQGKSKNPFDSNAGPTTHAGSSLHLESTCNLAALCEEGIEITKTAFCNLTKSSGSRPGVQQLQSTSPIELDFRVSRADWNFVCRPGIIRRLVLNLVSNSMKYTDSGSIRVELTQPECNDGSSEVPIVLTVTDTGKGMSSSFVKTALFVPFSQESTTAPGLGLGLSIVRASMQTLGGTVYVDSKQGEGTKVTMSFSARRPSVTGERVSSTSSMIDLEPLAASTGKTYGLFGPRMRKSTRHRETLRIYLEEWWLYQHVDSSIPADVTFIHEADVNTPWPPSKHYVVLTTAAISEPLPSHSGSPVTYLRLPFGPKSLSRAVVPPESHQYTLSRSSSQQEPLNRVRSTSTAHQHTRPHRLPVPRPPSPSLSFSSIPLHTSHPSEDAAANNDITLPTRPATQTPSTAHPHSDTHLPTLTTPLLPTTVTTSSPHRATSVLCVDDNPINLKLLQTYCTKLHFTHIATATNGLEAYEAVRSTYLHLPHLPSSSSTATATNNTLSNSQQSTAVSATVAGLPVFDLIFMDLTMPLCDGFESTRLIRQFEKEKRTLAENKREAPSPKAVVIAITALGSEADQKKAFAAGVDHFVTKPLRFKDFRGLLGELGLV